MKVYAIVHNLNGEEKIYCTNRNRTGFYRSLSSAKKVFNADVWPYGDGEYRLVSFELPPYELLSTSPLIPYSALYSYRDKYDGKFFSYREGDVIYYTHVTSIRLTDDHTCILHRETIAVTDEGDAVYLGYNDESSSILDSAARITEADYHRVRELLGKK